MNDAQEAPRWRLDQIYASLDNRSFSADTESVATDIGRIGVWFDKHRIGGGTPEETTAESAALVVSAIERLERVFKTQRRARAFVHALVSTDATDGKAATEQVHLVALSGSLSNLAGRLDAFIGRHNIDDLIHLDPRLGDYRHTLAKASTIAGHRMTDDEEALALELGLDGAVAWRQMRDEIAARIPVSVAAAISSTISMPQARSLASDPRAEVRDAALAAELEAWETNEVPMAAALNAFVGAQAKLNRRRGWPDDLAPALFENGIDREALEAMNAAVVGHLPHFRRFCAAKARALDRGPKLNWADLVAPLGDSREISWSSAVSTIRETFHRFSPELGSLVDRATNEGWIDGEIRDGKRDGAFCVPVEGDVSRILLNFNHSHGAVQTLAHELGHTFHNTQLADRTEFQRRTPRALAETASILCETIITDSLLDDSDEQDEFALLNTDLSAATQIVVDIHSRYLFERDLYELRKDRTVRAAEMCELMIVAQASSYGDAIADHHRYMWAVKPHYFSPFYNIPYTFGLLFALGLVKVRRDDPERFIDRYTSLLSRTAMAPVAQLATEFSIDLSDEGFWEAGLGRLVTRIDRFVHLAGGSPHPR